MGHFVLGVLATVVFEIVAIWALAAFVFHEEQHLVRAHPPYLDPERQDQETLLLERRAYWQAATHK